MRKIRRHIGFILKQDGTVSPALPQYGGVQGEHNVTSVSFTAEAPSPYQDGDLVRLRFVCGDGAVVSSDLIEDYQSQDGRFQVGYTLPATLTQMGGQLGIRVVLSRVDGKGDEVETYISGEAVVYFEDAATENGTPFWTGVSEMLKRTVAASEKAVEIAEDIGDALTLQKQVDEHAASIRELRTGFTGLMAKKLSVSGHEPNRFLGTNEKGEIITKNAPEGSGGVDESAVKSIVEAVAVTKSGQTPNKFLGTDEEGNVVAKDGGATDEQVQGAVDGFFENHPVRGVYIGSEKPPKGYSLRLDPNGKRRVYDPVTKTEEMTVPVGVDAEGRLWTLPSGADYEYWEGGAY